MSFYIIEVFDGVTKRRFGPGLDREVQARYLRDAGFVPDGHYGISRWSRSQVDGKTLKAEIIPIEDIEVLDDLLKVNNLTV